MPTYSDFTTVELQASVFTAGINFRTAKVLPALLGAWPERFTNVVHASDLPPNVPPELPHVIVQSGDSRYKAQAGPARLDLFWLRQAHDDVLNLHEHLEWCCKVIAGYLEAMQGSSRRLGCIMNRVAVVPNPAATLARHFFREGVIAPVPGIMRLFWAFSPSNPPESPSQEDSSLANMLDTLEARCRSDGPPAGPRSIDPLPGSRSFLTVSAVA